MHGYDRLHQRNHPLPGRHSYILGVLHVYTATVYVCTGMLIYSYNTWFDYLCICMLQLNIGIQLPCVRIHGYHACFIIQTTFPREIVCHCK